MWKDRKEFKQAPDNPPMREMARLILKDAAEVSDTGPLPANVRRPNLEVPQTLPTPSAAIPENEASGSALSEQDLQSLEKTKLKPLPEELNSTQNLSAEDKASRTTVSTPPQATKLKKKKKAPQTQDRFKQTPILESRERIKELQGKLPLSIKRTSLFSGFKEAVTYSRRYMPLPQEIQLSQRPEHKTWLVAKLQSCQNQRQLQNFADSLTTRDLDILFPSLASMKKGEEINKLLSVILLRASKYLYVQGWITLQFAYPRSTVQKGLAMLCEVLEEKQKSEQAEHYHLGQYRGLNLGTDHFDWQSVHLISEISLTNTRHFLSSIIKYLKDSQISGQEFFQKYGIYRDLALGQAIINQWDMAVFESNIHNNNDPLRSLFA